jgi:hypothetical protein
MLSLIRRCCVARRGEKGSSGHGMKFQLHRLMTGFGLTGLVPLCLRHSTHPRASSLHTRPRSAPRHRTKKNHLFTQSIESIYIFARQPRYAADNYARLLVAPRISSRYLLMRFLPLPTASSLGKLGSAVKRAPATRDAKRHNKCYFAPK